MKIGKSNSMNIIVNLCIISLIFVFSGCERNTSEDVTNIQTEDSQEDIITKDEAVTIETIVQKGNMDDEREKTIQKREEILALIETNFNKGFDKWDELEPGEITDLEINEFFWNHYLSSLVFNSQESTGNGFKELDFNSVSMFCGKSYVRSSEIWDIQSDSRNKVEIPIDILEIYEEVFFNNESSLLVGEERDKLENDFIYRSEKFIDLKSFEENYSKKLRMLSLSMLENKDIKAVIEMHRYENENDIEYLEVILTTSKLCPSVYQITSYSILDGKAYGTIIKHIKNGEAEEYTELKWNASWFDNAETPTLLGESANKIVLKCNSMGKVIVFTISKDDYGLLDEIAFEQVEDNYIKVKMINQDIVVMSKNSIDTYNLNFELNKSIELPRKIREIMNAEHEHDDRGHTTKGFFGYDLSNDYAEILYSTQDGLTIYNLEEESTKLLAEPKNIVWNSRKSFYQQPAFVGEDNNVMASIYGYESLFSFFYYNREAKVPKFFDLHGDEFNYDSSLGDYMSLTSSRIDYTTEESAGLVLFNHQDLNYYKAIENLDLAKGYIMWGVSFDGVNYGMYVERGYNEVLNRYVILVYKYDYESRELIDDTLDISRVYDISVIGILEDGTGIIMYGKEGYGDNHVVIF